MHTINKAITIAKVITVLQYSLGAITIAATLIQLYKSRMIPVIGEILGEALTMTANTAPDIDTTKEFIPRVSSMQTPREMIETAKAIGHEIMNSPNTTPFLNT